VILPPLVKADEGVTNADIPATSNIIAAVTNRKIGKRDPDWGMDFGIKVPLIALIGR
jgi:hypothetical protein